MDSLLKYQKELDDNSFKYKTICLTAADAKQVFKRLDRGTKGCLAKNKLKYKGSNANKETEALACEDYNEYLETLADMEGEFLKSEALKESYYNRMEALRTLISLNKSLLNLR